MTYLYWILGSLLGFYLLAPIPYMLTELRRHGWRNWCNSSRWNPERKWWWRLRHFVYHWYIWPFERMPRELRRKGYQEDWGAWYRCTFRWWHAVYHCWRHPTRCNFCRETALGVYAYGHGPISFAVCKEHAWVLGAPIEKVRELLDKAREVKCQSA
jgi:hypothetical protein